MNTLQLSLTILLLSVLTFSESEAQTRENEKIIPCESTDVHEGRLYGDSWHCLINTAKEFRKIIGGKSGIDFTKYTLIGVVYSSGGCKSPTVNHSISYSETNNSYRYELDIQQNGYCEPLFSGNIWCLVPKIKNEIKVDFVKNETIKP